MTHYTIRITKPAATPNIIKSEAIEAKYGKGAFVRRSHNDNQAPMWAVLIERNGFDMVLAKAATLEELM